MNKELKQILKRIAFYISIIYLIVAGLFLFYGMFVYEPHQEQHIVKRIICFETYVPSDFNYSGFFNLSTSLNSSQS